jgi:glycerol-3-phosphate acyltransferase PlsY
MIWLTYLAALVAAYLLGAIPVGYLAVKAIRKVDITSIGSGHTGGTNALRVGGPVAGAITVVADLAKGFGAVMLARYLVPNAPLVIALAGAMSVVGHNYSVFLHWRGGVGTMTTLGATLALMPVVAAIVLVVALLVIVISRYSSLGSLTLAGLLPLLCLGGALMGYWPIAYVALAVLTSVMAVRELRTNIERLKRGTERRLGHFVKAEHTDISAGNP